MKIKESRPYAEGIDNPEREGRIIDPKREKEEEKIDARTALLTLSPP